MDEQATAQVEVYSWGLVYVSACAPETVSRNDVEDAVNLSHPTGIKSRWRVADENFASGDDNPCACSDHPDRRHWLLSC